MYINSTKKDHWLSCFLKTTQIIHFRNKKKCLPPEDQPALTLTTDLMKNEGINRDLAPSRDKSVINGQ